MDTTKDVYTNGLYFNLNNYRNVLHSCNIAIYEHYANLIFGGDESRIIYASTDYAFRRRVQITGSSNLDLPFMSFRIAPGGIENNGDRRWWNHTLNSKGFFVPELGRKFRASPITIQYDSALFLHKEMDAMYAFSEILWDDSNETLLTPTLEVEGFTINNIGVLGYNPNYNEQYNENDWLERNEIHVVSLDMSLQTWMLRDNTSGFWIPSKVVTNFAQKHNLEGDNFDETYEAVINHFEKEVEDFQRV